MTTKIFRLQFTQADTSLQSVLVPQRAGVQAPTRIKLPAQSRVELAEVQTKLGPKQIQVKRVGEDLHVAFEGGDIAQPDLVLESYYQEGGHARLQGRIESGQFLDYVPHNGGAQEALTALTDSASSTQVLASEASRAGLASTAGGAAGGSFGLGWLPALALLGAAAGGGGGKSASAPTAPAAPQGDLSATSDTGARSDRVTRLSSPVLEGRGTAGETITVTIGGQTVSTQVSTAGTWSVAVPAPLADGTYTASIVASSGQGPMSTPTLVTLTVDSTAPAAPPVQVMATSDTGASSSDAATSDTTPSVSGTGAAGDAIQVTLPSGEVLRTTVAADGTWTVTPAEPLPQGAASITVVATDPAGNTSATSTLVVHVDSTAPTVAGAMALASDTGNDSGDRLTADATPSFSGTAEPGATITVELAGTTYSTVAAADGAWQITTTQVAPDGDQVALITATDTAGNRTVMQHRLVIDTSAPAATGTARLVAGDDSGANSGDGVTANSRPSVAVPGLQPGDTAVLLVDGQIVAAVFDPVAGTLSPVAPLGDGAHRISYQVTDASGNVSAPSPTADVVIDTSTPAAPGAFRLDTASDTGSSSTDSVTSSRLPGLAVSAPAAGETLTMYVDGVAVAATFDPATGLLTPNAALSDGPHAITYSVTDSAGNVSTLSTPLNVTIDSTAPSAPAAAPDLIASSDLGGNDGDDLSSDTTPSIAVGAPGAGNTLVLLVDGVVVAATYDSGTGTLTPNNVLGDGTHVISYAVVDAAGNQSAPSAPLSVTLDGSAPAAPNTAPDLIIASDTGSSSTDNIGGDTTPSFAVSAPSAGDSLVLLVDGVAVAATFDSGTGTLTPDTALGDGTHVITYAVLDAAGNQSAPSAPLSITLDGSPPAAPAVAPDLIGASDLGTSSSDDLTSDTTPSFAVGAPGAGNSWVLLVDGVAVAATYDSGAGTLTPNSPLADGTHVISHAVVDAAGNQSPASAPVSVTLDGSAPAAPAAAPDLITASDTGSSSTDNISGDTTPSFAVGAPDAGNSLVLLVDGVVVAATYDSGTGTLTPDSALGVGTYLISYAEVDAAGNQGAASTSLSVTLDNSAPAAPATGPDLITTSDLGSSSSDDLTGDTTPSFAVSAPGAGNSLVLLVDGVAVAATYDSGAGTLTPDSALVDGTHVITYTVMNAAGNQSAASAPLSVTVESLAPAAPTTAPDLINTSDLGNSNTDDLTSDATPSFAVNAPGAGNSLVLLVDGVTVAATYDSGAGTLTADSALADGARVITYAVVDAAGNQSVASASLSITVDSAAPAAPAAAPDLITSNDTGSSSTDNITGDTTPSLAVSAPSAGNSLVLLVDGVAVAATYDSGAGTLTPDSALGDGVHVITYAEVDAAGNQSAPSASLSVTLDASAPVAPAAAPDLITASDLGSSSSDDLTSDTTPSFAVAAPSAGNSLVLLVDGVAVAATYDSGTGTLTPNSALADGIHLISYAEVDAAGNQGAASTSLSVTLESSAPAAPASAPDLTTTSDLGVSNTDSITTDTTPSFAVSAPGAGNTLVLLVDGVAVAATYDSGTGTLTPNSALADGTYLISYAVVDAAGNQGTASTSLSVTLDNSAPAAPATAPDLIATSDLGSSSIDDLTGDTTPSFAVSAPGAGNTLVLLVDGVAVAATYDSGAGTLTPNSALGDGAHVITYAEVDAAGNQSAPSTSLSVTLESSAPAAPATAPDLIAASDSGVSNTDNFTTNRSPSLTVAAPPVGETIALYVDGVAVSATYDVAAGTLTPTAALADGVYAFTYAYIDEAGNVSVASPALTVTVDNLAPATPATAPDLATSSDTGVSATDDLTASRTPSLSLAAPGAGLLAELYVDGVWTLATYDAVARTLTPIVPLADGAYVFSYTLVDEAGNESAPSPSLTVTIDGAAPAAPATAPDLIASSDLGSSDSDDLTSDTTPSFAVSAPGAGNSLVLLVDGVAVAATYDSGAGTLTPNVALADGARTITYAVVDAAGNQSSASASLSVTIDATAPAAPATAPDLIAASDSGSSNTDNTTNDTTPSFAVSAPGAGNSLVLLVDGVAVAATYDSGAGTLTPNVALAQGSRTITYAVVDAAGNQGTASASLSVTIDATAPATPATAPDLIAASDSGSSTTDNLTGDTTPSFAVSAPGAGNSLVLLVDGVAVAATYDSGAGTLTPNVALAEGARTITYAVVDAAGNQGTASASLTVTIDGTAPADPLTAPDLVAASDLGISTTDNLTSDTTPTVTVGGVPVGGFATLYVNGVAVAATFDAGTGTLTPTVPLAAGSYNLSYTVSDAAGNPSGASPVLAVTVDTTAPATSSFSPADNATNVVPGTTIALTYNSAVFGGSGGQTITLYSGAGNVVETFNATTGVGSNGGSLSFVGNTVNLNLGSPTNGSTSYYVQAQAGAITDAAGNSAPAITNSTTFNFTTATLAAVTANNLASATYSKYLHTINPNLVNSNLLAYQPGTASFGTGYFAAADDASASVSITPAFAGGLNWFGTNYTNVGIGSNGYMTFGHLNSGYTSTGVSGYTAGGMIAVQYDDIDNIKAASISPGGNSLGTKSAYFNAYQYDGFGVVTLTYDDVAAYTQAAPGVSDGLSTNNYTVGNAMQIRLVSSGLGDTVIQLVYENVSWVNGNTGFPTAGWTKGDTATYGTVDGNVAGASTSGISGTVNFLDVELTSNVGIAGVWEWVIGPDGKVGSGTVPMLDVHNTATSQAVAQMSIASGSATYAQDPVFWDSRFTLSGGTISSVAGASFTPAEANVELRVRVTDGATGITYSKEVNVLLFDQIGYAANESIGLRSAADVAKLTNADAGQQVMNGKGGIDTLVFAGANLNLDMTNVVSAAAVNIEKVNLGSSGTLKLNLSDVIDMSAPNQFNSGNGWGTLGAFVSADQLVIDGSLGANLRVANMAQWNTVPVGTVSNGGQTYAIYNATGGTGQLLVDTDVVVIWMP